MAKRNGVNSTGRSTSKAIDGPFVPLLLSTADSPAWLAMSHGARSLYLTLKRRLTLKDPAKNNGRVFVSQREASREIGSSTEDVGRWFRELQHYGFIVMTTAGCLGSDGKGKAPHWRLTECGSRNPDGTSEPPTRDFLRWDGTKFKAQIRASRTRRKVKSRTAHAGQGVQHMRDTGV